jgi:hypothetical protein
VELFARETDATETVTAVVAVGAALEVRRARAPFGMATMRAPYERTRGKAVVRVHTTLAVDAVIAARKVAGILAKRGVGAA